MIPIPLIPVPPDVPKLDELLLATDECFPTDEAEMAREHVQEARTYLLGAMPIEYRWTLNLARQSIGRLRKTEASRRAEAILASLWKN